MPAVGEVLARRMHLGEVHLLIRTANPAMVAASAAGMPNVGQPVVIVVAGCMIPQQRLNLVLPHPVEGVGPSGDAPVCLEAHLSTRCSRFVPQTVVPE